MSDDGVHLYVLNANIEREILLNGKDDIHSPANPQLLYLKIAPRGSHLILRVSTAEVPRTKLPLIGSIQASSPHSLVGTLILTGHSVTYRRRQRT